MQITHLKNKINIFLQYLKLKNKKQSLHLLKIHP